MFSLQLGLSAVSFLFGSGLFWKKLSPTSPAVTAPRPKFPPDWTVTRRPIRGCSNHFSRVSSYPTLRLGRWSQPPTRVSSDVRLVIPHPNFILPRRLSLTCGPSTVAGDGAFYSPTHSSPPSDFLGRLRCHSPVSYAPPPLWLLEPSPIWCRSLVPSDPCIARLPIYLFVAVPSLRISPHPDEPG